VREVCSRCPLVMTEELLQDLAAYKSSKDKSELIVYIVRVYICSDFIACRGCCLIPRGHVHFSEIISVTKQYTFDFKYNTFIITPHSVDI